MKRIWLAFSALAVAGLNAEAADLAARPYIKAPQVTAAPLYDWTGFYIGGHVGYGQADINGAPAGAIGFPDIDQSGQFRDMQGWVGGVQGGLNYQVSSAVLGIEGDFSWTDIQRSTRLFGAIPGSYVDGAGKVEWLSSIRGRIGYAFDRFLVYGTAGAAWMNANLYRNAGILPAFVIYGPGFNDSATHAGWVAGAGIEGMISPNWTARLEYLHYEFDTANYFQSGARRILGGLDYDGKSDVVRVGLNYKFGWAGRPL